MRCDFFFNPSETPIIEFTRFATLVKCWQDLSKYTIPTNFEGMSVPTTVVGMLGLSVLPTKIVGMLYSSLTLDRTI